MAENEQQRMGEEQPLLGGPGDATQNDKPLYHNFLIGKLASYNHSDGRH